MSPFPFFPFSPEYHTLNKLAETSQCSVLLCCSAVMISFVYLSPLHRHNCSRFAFYKFPCQFIKTTRFCHNQRPHAGNKVMPHHDLAWHAAMTSYSTYCHALPYSIWQSAATSYGKHCHAKPWPKFNNLQQPHAANSTMLRHDSSSTTTQFAYKQRVTETTASPWIRSEPFWRSLI